MTTLTIHPFNPAATGGLVQATVLRPAAVEAGRRYRALYLLPVEGMGGDRYGDPVRLAAEMRLAERHDLIVVAPAFNTVPWYGSHVSDGAIRHAAALADVLPGVIDEAYPTMRAAEGRLLAGFSKSGWGAVSLLLGYPAMWGYAASWDAPLLLREGDIGQFELAEHYGSAGHLGEYVLEPRWRRAAERLQGRPRLAIGGSANFAAHTQGAHALLESLGIGHQYDNALTFPHRWDERWLEPLVEGVVGLGE